MRIKYPTDIVNNNVWTDTTRTTYSYTTYDHKRATITAEVISPEPLNCYDKRVYFAIANVIDLVSNRDKFTTTAVAVPLISGMVNELIARIIGSTADKVDQSISKMKNATIRINTTDEASKTRYPLIRVERPLLSLMTFNGIHNLPLFCFAAYRTQLCIFDAEYLRMTTELDPAVVDKYTINLMRAINADTAAIKKGVEPRQSVQYDDWRTASLIMDAARYCGLVDHYCMYEDGRMALASPARIEYTAPAVSQLQSQVRNVLDELLVPYSEEWEFADLLSPKGNPLRFDFLTVDNDNKPVLIEVQGEGHDHDGELNRMQREVTDDMKKEYCAAKGYRLVEIWYYDDIRAAVYQAVKREKSENE